MATPSTRLEVAGPYRRIFAFILDGAIIVVLSLSVASMFFGGPDEDPQSAKNFLISTGTQAVYTIVLMSAYSATPGMMALGIHVANTDGSRVLPDAVILRYLVFLLTWLPASLVLNMGAAVDVLMLLLNLVLVAVNLSLLFYSDRRRTIHDRVARTVVLLGRPRIDNDGRQL